MTRRLEMHFRYARRYVWLQDIVDAPGSYHPAMVAKLSGILIFLFTIGKAYRYELVI